MRRIIVHTVLMTGAVVVLTGCGLADSRAPVPEFMRAKTADPPADPPPDVKRLVREKLDTFFSSGSYPHQVQVSPPQHELHGVGWTACVRADLTSVNGKPLGTQTYRVTVSSGVINDRRRVEADDACASESYEPI